MRMDILYLASSSIGCTNILSALAVPVDYLCYLFIIILIMNFANSRVPVRLTENMWGGYLVSWGPVSYIMIIYLGG